MNVYILKMIQIITKLDEVLVIYIYEYEFIVPFQLQLKSLHHVISQINLGKFFIQMNISVLKKNCWNIFI
jgi:hypothetical protein